MKKPSKSKDQAEADQRRDELAKRVLKMPPQPKQGKPVKKPKGKTGADQHRS